ncbi:MAG: GNAT family N-acetyltransferase [Kofleriaceae bacterium]
MESETLDPDRVVIRPLTASDSRAYRRIRQHILDIGDGKFFSSSYTREQQFTSEDQWHARCAETAVQCVIGIFVDGELVGIMGMLPYGDPADHVTEWESTWIDQKYRRSGIARQAYERVCGWCHEHGYQYAIIDIRAGNARSREIRERQGAMYLCTQRDVVWADGSTADVDFFLLSLAPGTQRVRSPEQAIGLLAAALAFLRHDAAARA